MAESKTAIAVLGAGAWGTALSVLLARNGCAVWLWGHDPRQLSELKGSRENQVYLPGIPLPPAVTIAADIAKLSETVSSYMIAVPSHAFRATLVALQPSLDRRAVVACATKGLEPATGKLLHQVVAEVLDSDTRFGVISGPTFAREVALNLPTALTAASSTQAVADTIADWLRNDRMRVYTSQDVAGVQLGGAIKNVIAIAAGISDGLGFGANARAALITRGLAELMRLGVAMGGQKETFMGLTGAGDLILTCTDDSSRNRRVGLGLGQGRALPTVLHELGQEAEGIATAKELRALAKRLHVDMPISDQVYRVLYENLAPRVAVDLLLRREPRPEHERDTG